jgi:hypothetical protein
MSTSRFFRPSYISFLVGLATASTLIAAPTAVRAQNLTTPLGQSQLQGMTGKASRAGDPEREGSVRLRMRFDARDLMGLDLSQPMLLHFEELLVDQDGTRLVSIDGFGTSLPPMETRRGARPTSARFELPGRDRSGTKGSMSVRDGIADIKLRVSRARIAAPEACRLGADIADLHSRVRLVDADGTRVAADVTHVWQCKPTSCSQESADCFDLRIRRVRSSDSSGGNRRPDAKITADNLTRSSTEPNWIRLDASRSTDRDGRIVSYRFDLFLKDGRELMAMASPAPSTAPVTHVRLWPGDYVARLTATDDGNLQNIGERRFSIHGEAIATPLALGTLWGLGADWVPGDPSTVLTRQGGPLDFADILDAFVSGVTPSTPPTQGATLSTGLERSAAAIQNSCGSAGSKTGLAIDIIGGVILAASSVATMGGSDVAAGALALAGTAAQMGGTAASTAGGNQASSCIQAEIDNLADAVALQALQIQAIQNQLNLTDEAFYNAWMQALATESKDYRTLYYEAFQQASTTAGDPTAGCASGDSTCNPCQAPKGAGNVSLNGPSQDCQLSSGGDVGAFFAAAGLWQGSTGGPVTGICNQPLPFKGAATCAEGETVLQSYTHFLALQSKVDSLGSEFLNNLQSLTGTTVSNLQSCSKECWKNVGFAGSNQLWMETVENLYGELLGSDGRIHAVLRYSALSADARNANVLEAIDAYNRALTQYVQLAGTVIVQAFHMEWVVNNFNYYSTIDGGPVTNNEPPAPNIKSLTGDSWSGYYSGSIQPTNLAGCSDFGGEPCPWTANNELSDGSYGGGWVCKNTGNFCVPYDYGYQCTMKSSSGGQSCKPDASGACPGGACKYAFCNGKTGACAYGGKTQAPAEADIAAYNHAQYELALLYAERLNTLYQLFLRYLVTDLPAGPQSWPTTAIDGICTAGSALSSCGRQFCKVSCTDDSDCGTNGTCSSPQIDYGRVTTSAGWFVPATLATRSSYFVSQPMGLLSRNTPAPSGENLQPYFDTPAQHPSDPYDPSGTQCVADYGTPTGNLVASGQPGWNDPGENGTLYTCPEDYPYCTGYLYGYWWGQCSSRRPWTADAVLYQYPLLDLGACGQSLRQYNDQTGGGNLAGAWGSSGQCPSVFAVADGSAPLWGYYDGRTVQPYSFLVGQAARDAQTANLEIMCGRLGGDWNDSTAVCSDLTSGYAANACATYGGTWDGASVCHPPTACPDACSSAACSAAPAGFAPSELPGCATYQPPYNSSTTGFAYEPATFTPTDHGTGSQCTPLLWPTDGGPCTGFCSAGAIAGVTPALTGACVDASFAMQNAVAASPGESLTDCQACADEPQLALLAPMRGNLGSPGKGCSNVGFTEGPQLTLYRPESRLTNLGPSDDGALLCEGCVYLACGNYTQLDMTESSSEVMDVWPLDSSEGIGSVFPGSSSDSFCEYNSDTGNQPCAVGSLEWNYADMDSGIAISDYRARTGQASGFAQAQLSFSNYEEEHQNYPYQYVQSIDSGTENWGAGVLQMNSLGKNTGTSASSNYMSLSYRLPNPSVPVATDSPGSPSYGLFAWQGQDVGFQIIGQSLIGANCPNNTDQIDLDTHNNAAYCLSLATAVTNIDMDTFGWGCESVAPNNSAWGAPTYGTDSVNVPSDKPLGSAGDNGLRCTMNDGRTFDAQALLMPGGTLNKAQNQNNYYDYTGEQYIPYSQSGTLFFENTQRAASGICPAGCLNAIGDGYTDGPMPLSQYGVCSGFVSPAGYCGGYCYAQPQGTYGSGVAPLDCRGCLEEYSDEFTSCPEDYPFAYQGAGALGSYCCQSIPYASGDYEPSIMDHCPNNDYVACADSSKKCVSYSAPNVQYVPPATSTSSCFPSGTGALQSPFPWPY